MKDPRSGPMGVTAVVLLLLIKYGAVQTLLGSAHREVLILAPLLGRAAMPAVFLLTPYVREQGLGSHLARHVPRVAAALAVLIVAAACVIAFHSVGAAAVLGSAGLGLMWRNRMVSRLGGFTGDAAGALIESIEALVLVIAAACASLTEHHMAGAT
jgi:adenosylcobinamide-GDP ribazoletransferase